MKYEIECLGDINDRKIFNTIFEALEYLKMTYGYTDPEDNRMLVWEIMPSGHKKVVWHFSGWHWDSTEFGIPQGKFLEDESAYDKANDQ